MRQRAIRRVGLLALTGLWATTAAAPVGAGEIVVQADGDAVPAVRYAGSNRYDTAATIATDDTSTGSSHDGDAVILTRGDTYPDGLAGAYLSGAVDAPMLLTETDSLPPATARAMRRLDPSTVYVLGGSVAISADVQDQIEADGRTVVRIDGRDRYVTAARIARRASDGPTARAIVALGTNFPDALVAGPVSAAGGIPLLLTEHGQLPGATARALQDLEVQTVLLAGGTTAVSDAVEAQIEDLGIRVRRIAGENRNETATEFADFAVNQLGFTTTHVNLATGDNFADALAIGPHAAADYPGPSPVLLATATSLPADTATWLESNADAGNSAIHVAGGTVAISDAVVEAARAAYTPDDWMSPAQFASQLDTSDVRTHLQALQAIAEANGGTRASSTPGYDASVDYIKALLDQAGYDTTVQQFTFDYFETVTDPTFSQTGGEDAPQDFTLADGPDATDADFAAMSFSGSGEVTDAAIEAVDLAVDNGGDSTSGCEVADFDTFTAGSVALIQRGACAFAVKAANAFDAGATGVIIFNQGDDLENPERTDVFFGTLGEPIDVDEDGEPDGPVISASYDVGVALAADDADGEAVTVSIAIDALNEERSTSNLLAETPTGDPDNVVMAGAHLDSIPEGSGMSDNGAGAAAQLEVALELAATDAPINNQVRFAWWGAEESGLVGSTYYVDTVLINEDFTALTPEGEAVALYLNFDMIGSTNFARFVYDGDGSAFGVGDPGSGVIEQGFTDFFAARDLASEPTAFSGRSDYAEFQVAGIPTGGLFTGAEGVKTEEQVALYGGEAGVAYDPCYHQACDDLDNVSYVAIRQMMRAMGHEVYGYAQSTASVDAAVERSMTRAPASASAGAAADQRGNDMLR